MATAVIMPRQGQSVESCIITKWHKRPGDAVKTGELLFSYETDKATFDEEAKVEGTLLAAFFQEGDDVPCLTNVCAIGAAGEDASAFAPEGAASAAAAVEVKETAVVQPISAQAQPAQQPSGNAAASPRAKKLAQASGANLALAQGTGPNGRIIERDVQTLIQNGQMATSAAAQGYAALGTAVQGTGIGGRITVADVASATAPAPVPAAAPAAETAGYRDEPLPQIRKVIARAMHQSLTEMAQLTHNLSYDATDLLALRARFKASGDEMGLGAVTLNDLILFAVSRTLTKHAALNAHFLGDSMRFFNDVHLGIAVDTPRGLMVPTLRNANRLTLPELSKQAKALAASCIAGSISPDLLAGGTFTVSNLGGLGIETFTPVINPPQTGILGVNTIVERPRTGKNGIELYPCMSLSLTYDHRALDGAPASRFLQELAKNLERITLLVCGG